jgi:hypothetical protein
VLIFSEILKFPAFYLICLAIICLTFRYLIRERSPKISSELVESISLSAIVNETAGSSEMSVHFYQISHCHI